MRPIRRICVLVIIACASAGFAAEVARPAQPQGIGVYGVAVSYLKEALEKPLNDADRYQTSLSLARLYVRQAFEEKNPASANKAEALLRSMMDTVTGQPRIAVLDEYGGLLIRSGRAVDATHVYDELQAALAADPKAVTSTVAGRYLLNAGMAWERSGNDVEALARYRAVLRIQPSNAAACHSMAANVMKTTDQVPAIANLKALIDEHRFSCTEEVLLAGFHSDHWLQDATGYEELLTLLARYIVAARVSPDDASKWTILPAISCAVCNSKLAALKYAISSETSGTIKEKVSAGPDLILTPELAAERADGWSATEESRRLFAELIALSGKQQQPTQGRDLTLLRLLYAWNLQRTNTDIALDLLDVLNDYESPPEWARKVVAEISSSDIGGKTKDPLASVRFHSALGTLFVRNDDTEHALNEWKAAVDAYGRLGDQQRAVTPMADIYAQLGEASASTGRSSDARDAYAQAVKTYAAEGRSAEGRSLFTRLTALPSGSAADAAKIEDLKKYLEGTTSTGSPHETESEYVKAWIAADPRFRSATLDVLKRGGKVTLSGVIDSDVHLTDLTTAVRQIPGVTNLTSNVVVVPPPKSAPKE